MKRTLLLLSAALFAGALASPAMAQETEPGTRPVATGQGEHHPSVQQFDGYFNAHPEVTKQLNQNPSLISNQQYLEHHPELREYLHQHPHAAQAFKTHPYAFRNREHRYERGESHWWQRHHENTVNANNQ
jgi:hypothetical protein